MSGKGHIAHSVTVAEEHPYQPMTAPVLVLNASYEPINVCAARRAIVLVLKGVAAPVTGYVVESLEEDA